MIVPLRIIWKRQALHRVDEIASWYENNMGRTAMHSFLQGVANTVSTLSHSPQIGILDERRSTPRRKLYSFVTHPKYKIIYYFTSKTIYIVTIHRTMMKNG
ncbi:MAG: type II toxin-antitoxin system RelE/ParE family toxin [Bacteroidaceae bacterium]|nr:type II toxin-antitoxin system RelE/ParE family toxin [Bacteroidaceae bacterium]